MGETRLYDTKSTHCSTRWIIGTNRPTINNCVVALVRSLRVRDAVDENRRRCAAIGTTVKHHARFDLDDLAVEIGMMLHPDLGWVTVHMTVEAFFASVRNADWSTSLHREESSVDLQTDIFSCAKSATDSAQDEPNVLFGNIQAIGDLLAIFMEPLGRHIHLESCAI